MIRSFYLTTLFALVSSFATGASAQGTFKLKFPDGRKSTTVTQVKSEQTLTLVGMELISGSEQTITVTSTNGQRADDGKLVVKSTIDALEASVTLPGGTELQFDSADPDADPPGTQFDFVLDIFKATAKSTWATTMSQDNRVVAVEGRDNAFGDLPQNLQDAMKSQLDPEYLKTAANDELDKLPSKPVSPGDSWERTALMRLDSGQKLTFTTKYTYEGRIEQNGKTLEKIVSQTTKVDYSADADAPLKVVESDLKVAASEGQILFDAAYGQTVLQQSKVQVTGSLKLEINGMELPGELDLTIGNKTTIKL
ncbi:MAG: DUF6263 family protein [Pirellulaceae bacterium]|jgi:hypothetical protein|nr:hypothetical protein [Planctomycetaceae bacterium]MDP6555596.1 DUF6263 family protein [Pirellulaceae bacterium]MDP6717662.1 DUF6263 family protein [Pirellulaceae bacterium]